MVKLIKLCSQDLITLNKKARFTANFQEDIILKPNSKIALKNIQFSLDNYDRIDFYCGIDVSLYKNANGSLNNKRYVVEVVEATEQQPLSQDIYGGLNSLFKQTDCPLIRTGIFNRVMFDTKYNALNKFELSYKFIEDSYNTQLTTNNNIQYNNTNLYYTKTGNYGNWDFISSALPICLGTGTAKFKVITLVGFLIGVSNLSPVYNAGPNEFQFKIFSDATSNNYQVQYGTNQSEDTGILIQVNDICEIVIEEGQFKFKVTRNNGTGPTITPDITSIIKYFNVIENTGEIDGKNEYYAYFGLKEQTSSICDIVYTQSPFYITNETGIYKISDIPHVVQSSLSDATPSHVTISFFGENSEEVPFYQILGYTNISYDIYGVSGTFTGELTTTDTSLPDGFYITIDNMRLDSYDYNPMQKTGRRKNILYNLLNYQFSATYNIIKFETDDPVYIDLNNKEEITFNYLQISIYDQYNRLIALGYPDTSLVKIDETNLSPIKMSILIDG